MLELLVLKNAAECTSQRLKWRSGARVIIILRFDLRTNGWKVGRTNRYKPLQPVTDRYSPLQTVADSPLQLVTDRYNPLQLVTNRYSSLQTVAARYRQTVTDRYSPLQADRYRRCRPLQTVTDRYTTKKTHKRMTKSFH